jgi:HAD superfamily hydrolase (TIGR01509 family)
VTPFDLVIFDCDGVLVDSERINVRVDAEVITELGWPITEAEVIERFVGRTDAYQRAAIEERLGRPLPDDYDAVYAPRYRTALEADLAPVDGIVAALDAIDTATCVASSGTHDTLRFTLGLTGLYGRFAGRIFSATEVARGKPAPDLFLYAAERMDVDASRCAVVEDSRFGIEAALTAGMRSFAYAGGVTPRARLELPGTVVFDRMRDLPDLLAAG